MNEINNGPGRTEPAAELLTAYEQALTVLGYQKWLDAVPPLRTDDPLRRALALSQLVVRAAGLHARAIEPRLTSTNLDDDLRDALDPVVAMPGDENQLERALWEVRQAGALLAHLDIGAQADPYVAAAAAATAAAETLLFAPMRRLDSFESALPSVAAHYTRAHLDHAREALRRALDAIDAAHDKLGPDTD